MLIRDLRPGQHTKWQKGTVTATLGGPRYLVNVGGEHTREVHVDHLQPGVNKEHVAKDSEQLLDNSPVPPPRRSKREKVQQKRLLDEM